MTQWKKGPSRADQLRECMLRAHPEIRKEIGTNAWIGNWGVGCNLQVPECSCEKSQNKFTYSQPLIRNITHSLTRPNKDSLLELWGVTLLFHPSYISYTEDSTYYFPAAAAQPQHTHILINPSSRQLERWSECAPAFFLWNCVSDSFERDWSLGVMLFRMVFSVSRGGYGKNLTCSFIILLN